jgi:glycosyltransferase involved in cell wall biosynthesis
MVIPQSLAAGVPVVVTRVGGSPEAVREGETGFVVEPGDLQSMAEKVKAILRNEELARRLSAAGPAAVAAWDQDKMVRDHEILYNSLLEEYSA